MATSKILKFSDGSQCLVSVFSFIRLTFEITIRLAGCFSHEQFMNKPKLPQQNVSSVMSTDIQPNFVESNRNVKNFVSQSRRTTQRGSQRLVEEQNLEKEEFFSFIQSENNLAIELVLDSAATSHMIEEKSLFIDIDKEYSGTITNANSSKILISGKGTVEIRVLDSSCSERKIKLSNALPLPNNTRNLVSVSKLRTTGNEVFRK